MLELFWFFRVWYSVLAEEGSSKADSEERTEASAQLIKEARLGCLAKDCLTAAEAPCANASHGYAML
jgi:hypothetical protein